MEKRILPVNGMTCASCAVSVESQLKDLEGVTEATVNFADASVQLGYEPSRVDWPEMQKALRQIGYDLVLRESTDPLAEMQRREAQRVQQSRERFIGSAAFALPVFVLSMFFPQWYYTPWLAMLLSLPVLAWFGGHFFRNSGHLARRGKTNMDTLVALSTGSAYLFSVFNTLYPHFLESRGLEAHIYYEAALMVIAFVSLGKWLEERAKRGTSEALKKLLALQAKTVKVITAAEKEVELPIEEVAPGSTVMIRPGERIPLDGEVSLGHSSVDQSNITGESIPVEKGLGDPVYAGTHNQEGAFRMITSKAAGDTVLGQMIQTVRQAQGSKAPAQRLADRISAVFVPTVIGIALITFATWAMTNNENRFQIALLTSLSVLVIACPCALGLATPTAVMVGVGKGAQGQILIKDAASLEKAQSIDTVVFDKTGTLTEGHPALQEEEWFSDDPRHRARIYALENQSQHPLAQCLREAFAGDRQDLEIADFQSHTGRGLSGREGKTVLRLGNAAFVAEKGALPAEAEKTAQQWQEKGYTVLYYQADGELCALLALADPLKKGARDAIEALRKQNRRILLFTGDNQATGRALGHELGLDEVKAEMLPRDKAEGIARLQKEGRKVAMVGDGVNDAEALSQADLALAMGKGSDLALEVADIAIGNGKPYAVVQAFKLSAQIRRGIRQNLFWAFVYNVLAIPLAAGSLYPINGFLIDPVWAGAAMAFSSFSVVLNSLRLKQLKL